MNEMEMNAHIGMRINARRRVIGLTQKQLATSCGVSPQQIHRWECGSNGIYSAQLLALSKALTVTPGYFFDQPARAAAMAAPRLTTGSRVGGLIAEERPSFV